MFETEIQRGIALLDEKRPGWLDIIDLDHLRLEEGSYDPGTCGCICAQVNYAFGTEQTGMWSRELPFLGLLGLDSPAYYGFSLRSGVDCSSRWIALTEEWKQAIIALRAERVHVGEFELATAGD